MSFCLLTAAAAAKINAQIQAKKGIQHVDVPPIKSTSQSPGPNAAAGGAPAANINGEVYIADGDYIKDIEVNDLRNRYLLTKGSTQKMVNNTLWLISTDPFQRVSDFQTFRNLAFQPSNLLPLL